MMYIFMGRGICNVGLAAGVGVGYTPARYGIHKKTTYKNSLIIKTKPQTYIRDSNKPLSHGDV